MSRGWKLTMKKIVVFMIALCLLLPQAAFAVEDESASVPIWNFKDISTHWGKKNIHKMGLLEITNGFPDGTYRPNDSITQEQAIIMLIRMMGKEDEIRTGVDITGLEVSKNAKGHVVLAIDLGLLNYAEEIRTDGSAVLSWGATPASRQWLTKVIIRAIGQQDKANALAEVTPDFIDANRISNGYAGYINAAHELGIVSGILDSKTKQFRFDPQATVTRAQMAAFLGNAEKHLAARHAHIVIGQLEKIDGQAITINTASGLKQYALSSQSVFFRHDSNDAISPSSLAAGDTVYLIQYGQTAYYVEKTDAEEQKPITPSAESFTGVLVNISMNTMRIYLDIDGEIEQFSFNEFVRVTSEQGSGLSLNDLSEGSTVELVRSRDSAEISSIILKKASVQQTISGTIERISGSIIEVKESASGVKNFHDIPADLEIVSGTRTITMDELYIGDEVTIMIKDGNVVSLSVTKPVIETVEGKVFSVDTALKVINLMEGNRSIGYFVEPGVTVRITGMTSAGLEDVQTNDEVTLELNANDKVQKIIVNNRSIDARMGVEFLDYYEEYNTIVIPGSDNKPELKELSDTTVIDYNGLNIQMSEIKNYFTKGRKIDLIFSGDRIVKMSLSSKYRGIVTDIDPRTNTIRINADEFGSTAFAYVTVPIVDLFGKSTTSLADVRIGDQVELELNHTQDKVQYIRIIQKQLFKVKEKLSYRLTVTDEKGTEYAVNNVTTAAVTHYDKLFASYSADVLKGSYVMITFEGSLPKSIHVPKVSYGIVNSVDTSRNTFGYTEYGQPARTVVSNTDVVINQNRVNHINSLKAGDRIHLVEGQDGVKWIDILAKQTRSFFAYDAKNNAIEFTRLSASENSRFTIHENVHLHQNGQSFAITSIKRTDSLNVYIHNDTVVEIEKR